MSPLASIRQVTTCVMTVLRANGLAAALGFGACCVTSSSAAIAAESPAALPEPTVLQPNVPAQIAHSALLSVEATAKPDVLQISIRRMADKSLIGTDEITVAVDSRNESVTREKGTVYEIPINDLRGDGVKDVDVTVAHDGIREIVSGKISVAEAPAASLWRDHKQVAWWVLNIVIILVAVMAFSRKKTASETPEEEEGS